MALVPMQTPNKNTCTNCGKPLDEVCYAENEQAAIAGLALCEACAVPPPEPEPAKPTPRKRTTKRSAA
ncbi:MAG: hypothetical protein KDI07_21170 [Anaerolineae bacterium]|nr:hypothetical protein [Anaerolineae bacterium]